LAKDNRVTFDELPSAISSDHPSPLSVGPDRVLSLKKASRILERDLIKKVLKLTKGNRSKASRILEISRPILISKIKEYELGIDNK
ncbi:MAG: sigma-54-dependent Fis family transcriptional regulator, partial [Deltaproteobacteria bacterium]|nr:sigma-54-dependent Fis family transcriptional regulator [Deltaproteobacteria bacterium]